MLNSLIRGRILSLFMVIASVLIIYIHLSSYLAIFLAIFLSSNKVRKKDGYMKIIGICNQKGGCGKTTTTMNLAGGLTKIGYRVQVVDADPQASSTVWSLASGADGVPFEVLTSKQIGYQFSRLLDVGANYDIALVDFPHGMVDASVANPFMRFALTALHQSDLLLVPLMPSSLDFSAARSFVRYLRQEKPAETRLVVLLNAMQRTRLSAQARAVAEDLFAPIGGAVLQTTLGRRVSITEVCGLGKTVFDFSLRSSAAQEYTSLAKELLECLASPLLSSPTTSPTSQSSAATSAPAELQPHPSQSDTTEELGILWPPLSR